MKSIFRHLINVLFFNLLFDTRICFSEYIYESQFDALRDSLKHHFQYKKNITRIPHDCSDSPSVAIDMVFKEDNVNATKYYAVFGDKKYFVEIDGITRDHLPIVRRSVQPRPVDSRFQRKMTGKNAIKEYKFVGPVYLHKVPTEKDKYELIGFNQVWLGCPQPLCISPGFDGILSMNPVFNNMHHSHRSNHARHYIIIFRGNYFWYYELDPKKSPTQPPLSEASIRIEERWIDRRAYRYSRSYRSKSLLNDSMVVPTYMDAVVPGMNKYNNCIYFFKDDSFVCFESFSKLSTPLKIASQWKSDDKTWSTAKIEAAFHVKGLIYFIADDKLWCFMSDRSSCISYPKKLTDIHPDFPTGIRTAFEHREFIYVIKGSVYYKIAVSRFPMKITKEDLKERDLFQEVLGCHEGLYTAWGFDNYENFIETIAKRLHYNVNSTAADRRSKFNPTFLIISLLVVLIGCSALLSVWYFRPNWITKFMQKLKRSSI